MRAAVFFERDGVLVRAGAGNGPITSLDQFAVLDDAVEPLRRLREAGFRLFATTNQPGVTEGAPTRRELDLMHAVLTRKLELLDVLVCPHPPEDQCPCRKPQPGLLREACRRHGMDLDHSFVVSDRWVDAEMADAAGATSVLIRSDRNGHGHHDFIVENLSAAVDKILEIASGMGILRAMGPKAAEVAHDSSNGNGQAHAAAPAKAGRSRTPRASSTRRK